jgi:hypothetical protein
MTVDVTRVIRDIDLLLPKVRDMGIEFVWKARYENGLCVGVFETIRFHERQDYLYSTGKSSVKGDSPHAYHVLKQALDVLYMDIYSDWTWDKASHAYSIPPDKVFEFGYNWDKLGELGQQIGFAWGGTWKNPHDIYHFEVHEV